MQMNVFRQMKKLSPRAVWLLLPAVLLALSGCIGMPETQREILEGRAEAERLGGVDESQIKMRLPDESANPPVSLAQLYKELEFNPDSAGIHSVALFDPEGIFYARKFKEEAVKKVAELYPNIEPVDNEADAFRHAYFSFRLADAIGVKRAKKFTDAYEVSNINKLGGRCMDLWNNREGRRMSVESQNLKTSDRRAVAEDLVKEAIKSKRLMLEPFLLLD